jgi:hypothetical protein
MLTLLISFGFAALQLPAQVTNAQISGHARDASGGVVPHVKVMVASRQIGLERIVYTNESGYYLVTNLPVGRYDVTGEVSGFKTFTLTGINLDAGAAISVDLNLELGAVAERVEVNATLQTVNTDSSQVGRMVGRDQLLELPVSGRSFINLVGLQAGVENSGNFNDFNASPYGVGGWHINGSQGYQNLWQIDGVAAVRTRANNFLTGTANIDSVQEVQITTSAFKAEYGRNSGGQVNFVTKSGTQEFHGAAYWYGRNDKMDAKSFFAARKEHLRYNNFGWNLGGPVYIPGKWNTDKSKLFVFFSVEWGRYRSGSTRVDWMPPLELRQGNFNLPYRPSGTPVPLDPLSKLPFPDNIVPASRMSANGRGFAQVFPAPTLPNVYVGNNWVKELLSRTDVRPLTLKLDYNAGKSRVTFRGDYTNAYDYSPQSFSIPATLYYDRPKENGMLQITSVLTPTLLNQFSFGATVDVNIIDTTGDGWDRTKYGISYPFYYDASLKINPTKIPNVSISGIGSFSGGPYPSHSTGPIYQWHDDLSKVLGAHNFKTGVYYERAQQNDMDAVLVGGMNQNGVFSFGASKSNPMTTGNAMADMLMGNFDTYQEIGWRVMIPWRSNAIEVYAQDSWKARKDLTLEYGLRWSYMPPFGSKWNNFQSFNPRFYDPVKAVTVNPNGTIVPGSGDIYNGITLPGSGWPAGAADHVPFAKDPASAALFHNLPYTLTDTHQLWGPRFGFAWDVGGRHKTAVRGGAGIFYDRITCNDSIHPGGVSPLQPIVSISNGAVDSPAGTATTRPLYPLPGAMIDPVSKNPTSYQWSFGVQHELLSNLLLDVTYVGNQGRHLYGGINFNQPQLGASFKNPGVALDALRPYRGMSYIRFTENAYNSNYNALQVTVNRRFSNGLQFGVAYTWSKAMDEAEGFGDNALNQYDPHAFRYGRAGFNRQHMLVLTYIYQLPFLRNQPGVIGKVLGGWQFSGLTNFQSGQPTGLGVSGDISGTGQGARPIWVANPNLPKDQRTITKYFNTAAIAVPPNGTWGNLGRNVLVGPGLNNWDLALSKNFKMTESMRLQFRSEFFNAFNHTQFSGLSTTFGTGNYGYVTSTRSPRIIQLGLRLSF